MRLDNAIQTRLGPTARADGSQAVRDQPDGDRSTAGASSFGGVLADVTAGDGQKAATNGQTETAPSPPNAPIAPNTGDPLLLAQALAAAAQGEATHENAKQDVTDGQQPQNASAIAKAATKDSTDQSAEADKKTTDTTGADPTLGFLAMFLTGPTAAATQTPASPPGASSRNLSDASAAGGTAGLSTNAISSSATGAVGLAQVAVQTHLALASAAASPTTVSAAQAAPSTPPRLTPIPAASDRVSQTGSASPTHETANAAASTAVVEPTAVVKPSAVDGVTDPTLSPRRDTAPIVPGTLPVMPGTSPVQTIAGAIVDLASSAAASAAVAAQPVATTTPIAQTLTLQLSPADLGTVDIRMHMSGDGLDVELTLSDARTYGLVSRDRDDLAAALGDSNYSLQSLTIQDGGASSSTGGSHASFSDSPGGEPRSDGSAGDTNSGQSDRGRGQSRDEGRAGRSAATDSTVAGSGDRRGGGSLFI